MTSNILIRSRCHEHPDPPQYAIEYRHLGKTHYLSLAERHAVERSGRSTWEEYAIEPMPPIHHALLCERRIDMMTRPGQTKVGHSPVQFAVYPKYPILSRYPMQAIKPTAPKVVPLHHLVSEGKATVSVCGKMPLPEYLLGRTRFERVLNHSDTCPKCAAILGDRVNKEVEAEQARRAKSLRKAHNSVMVPFEEAARLHGVQACHIAQHVKRGAVKGHVASGVVSVSSLEAYLCSRP